MLSRIPSWQKKNQDCVKCYEIDIGVNVALQFDEGKGWIYNYDISSKTNNHDYKRLVNINE